MKNSILAATALFFSPFAFAEPGSKVAPCSLTSEVVLQQIIGIGGTNSFAVGKTKATAFPVNKWIISWKTSVLAPLLSNPTFQGSKQLIPLSLAGDALESLDWMLGILNTKLQAANLADAAKLRSFQAELFAMRKNAVDKKSFDMVLMLKKSTEFQHYMQQLEEKTALSPLTEGSISSTLKFIEDHPIATIVSTHHPISVENFNDLSPYPVYIMGTVAESSYADGGPMLSRAFGDHDLGHLRDMGRRDEDLLKITGPKSEVPSADRKRLLLKTIEERENYYRSFRQLVDAQTDPEQKALLNLVWYETYHETTTAYTKSGLQDFLTATGTYWNDKLYKNVSDNKAFIKVRSTLNLDIVLREKYPFATEEKIRKAIDTLLRHFSPKEVKPVNTWIHSWKTNSTKPQIETLDWMITELDLFSTQSANPNDKLKLKSLRDELVEFKSKTVSSGNLDAIAFIEKSSRFARASAQIEAKEAINFNEPVFWLKEAQSELKKRPGSLLLPTSKELSIRDINDLSPYPIYPVGITKRSAWVDGYTQNPEQFLSHDLGHFSELANRDRELYSEFNPIKRQTIIKRREAFYEGFRSLVETEQSHEQKEILDLLWFAAYREDGVELNKTALNSYVKTRAAAKLESLFASDKALRAKYSFATKENIQKAINTLLKYTSF